MYAIRSYYAGYEIAGIHGFGAIGGGYLAQIFSYWDGYTRPQELIAATPNPILLQLINSFGKYRVKYESLAYFQSIETVITSYSIHYTKLYDTLYSYVLSKQELDVNYQPIVSVSKQSIIGYESLLRTYFQGELT